jgi:hypothetical protein
MISTTTRWILAAVVLCVAVTEFKISRRDPALPEMAAKPSSERAAFDKKSRNPSTSSIEKSSSVSSSSLLAAQREIAAVPAGKLYHHATDESEVLRFLPKGPMSMAVGYLLEHMNCNHHGLNQDPKYYEALKTLNADPTHSLRLFNDILKAVPEKFHRERQEVLFFARDLKLSLEDRSEFYLAQTLKEVGSKNSFEARLERQTAFDYFLDQPGLSDIQKETALHQALEAHRDATELQRQLILLYARFDENNARNLAQKYKIEL